MTSKNSFWVSLIENNKRRIWVWLLAAFSYMIVYPAALAMGISRETMEKEYLVESLGEELGAAAVHSQVLEVVKAFMGVSDVFLMMLAAAVAVVSAIQGFSYLYSRKKIDFYMGMPVKRNRRFAIIWINGVLIHVVPQLLGLVIAGVIAAANGAMTGEILRESALAFGLRLAFYLGVYHLTILAVMLTGNVIITCFGTAVFFLYEWAVRNMILTYEELFFRFFSRNGTSSNPRLSPFAILGNFMDQHARGQGSALLTAFNLLLFAGVVLLIAYLCYLRRPAEAAGRSMAFQFPQAFIKILLVVPAALISGCLVGSIVNYQPNYGSGSVGYVIFTMAVVTVAASCLIQVLYEFDIMGLVHKKRHILISAAMVAVIFLSFRMDVFGYDDYIPDVESVSSAAVVPPYEYRYYGESFFNENMNPVSKVRYAEDNMYLTDVGAVNQLMKISVEELSEYEDLSGMYEDEKEWYEVTLLFRLKNKRNVYLNIYVNVNNPEVVELLDRIESSKEYISGIYAAASDGFANMLADEENRITVYYGNNIYENKLSRQEARELLALYREDIKDTGFSKLRSSIPAGSLRFSIEKTYPLYSSYYNMEVMIYPFFHNCVEYLTEHGCYMQQHVNPQDVEKIQITNYNSSVSDERQKQWRESGMLAQAEKATQNMDWNQSDYWRYLSVDKEEEIKELCGMIYPGDWLRNSFHMNVQGDWDYVVTVYFKSGSKAAKDNGSVGNYCFERGKVPQFVVDATAWQE